VYFKAPHHKAEVSKKEPSSITKTKLVKDQGVVTLETSCDTSSSESEMEVEPLPPVAVKKRVYEEIGKNIGFVLYLVYRHSNLIFLSFP
jgi:hypothetical protein